MRSTESSAATVSDETERVYLRSSSGKFSGTLRNETVSGSVATRFTGMVTETLLTS